VGIVFRSQNHNERLLMRVAASVSFFGGEDGGGKNSRRIYGKTDSELERRWNGAAVGHFSRREHTA
jgi:hypothetical protein